MSEVHDAPKSFEYNISEEIYQIRGENEMLVELFEFEVKSWNPVTVFGWPIAVDWSNLQYPANPLSLPTNRDWKLFAICDAERVTFHKRTSDIEPRKNLSGRSRLSLPIISGVVLTANCPSDTFVEEFTKTPLMYKDIVPVEELYVPATWYHEPSLYGKGDVTDIELLDVLLITWKPILPFEPESIDNLNCESLVDPLTQRETNVENWFWLFVSAVRNQHSTVVFDTIEFHVDLFPKLIQILWRLEIEFEGTLVIQKVPTHIIRGSNVTTFAWKFKST